MVFAGVSAGLARHESTQNLAGRYKGASRIHLRPHFYTNNLLTNICYLIYLSSQRNMGYLIPKYFCFSWEIILAWNILTAPYTIWISNVKCKRKYGPRLMYFQIQFGKEPCISLLLPSDSSVANFPEPNFSQIRDSSYPANLILLGKIQLTLLSEGAHILNLFQKWDQIKWNWLIFSLFLCSKLEAANIWRSVQPE